MRYVRTILKYLAVILILIFLFYIISTQIGFRNIYYILEGMNGFYLILAFLSAVLYMSVWMLRDYYTLRRVKKIRFLPVIPIFLTGIFVNNITPGAKTGGEPVRAYYLSKRFGMSKTRAFAAAVLNIMHNLIIFAVLCIFSIFFVIMYIQIAFVFKVILIFLLIGIPLIIFILFLLKRRIKNLILKTLLGRIYHTFLFNKIRERFDTHHKFNGYINRRLRIFSKFIKKSFRNRSLIIGLLATCFFYLFRFLSVYLIFLALGVKISFISIMIVVTLAILLGDLSFLPGGIGITEGFMIALYLAFSIDPVIAVTVTMIDRAMEYFFSLILGAICFMYITLARKWD